MVFLISNLKGACNSLIRFHFPPQAAGVVAPKKTFLSAAKEKGGHPKSCPKFRSAGEGNRTLVSSLEGYSFTIKLHPHESRPSCRACGFLPSAFSMGSRLANACRRH